MAVCIYMSCPFLSLPLSLFPMTAFTNAAAPPAPSLSLSLSLSLSPRALFAHASYPYPSTFPYLQWLYSFTCAVPFSLLPSHVPNDSIYS